MTAGDVAPGPPAHVRALVAADWPAVARIYAQGIATGLATFETAVPSWAEWDGAHHAFGRLVAVVGDEVAGWAALGPVSRRPAYAGVAEVSVYVAPEHWRAGLGRRLLAALVAGSERHGIWTLQSSVFPENAASKALHERLGFRVVGRRERIGRLGGVWRDTLLLERRAAAVE